jgi:hypothetical protein
MRWSARIDQADPNGRPAGGPLQGRRECAKCPEFRQPSIAEKSG